MPALPYRFVVAALLLSLAACGDRETAIGEPDRGREAEANLQAAAEPVALPAAAPAVVPEREIAAIPERFRGLWDVDAAACAGRPGEMRLTVEPDRLLFHESVARVVAVRPGEAEAVAVDLALEGEGESWRETRTLRLADEDRLEVTAGDASAMRVRCAGG